VARSCEHGNEVCASVKGLELLDKLSDCQLPRTLRYLFSFIYLTVMQFITFQIIDIYDP
jgi:hypothetical protein